MSDLIAKPIIKDQYWVVTDGERKVGNVQANSAGYEVILNGSAHQFNNTDDIRKQTKIKFVHLKSDNRKVEYPYPDYPTPKTTHNDVFDVKRKLHLFTKSAKSKCLHCAGWFVLQISDTPEVIFCPKYIFIQRYTYEGPFKTEDEARAAINT